MVADLPASRMPVRSAPSANGAAAGQEMVDDQHDDGADHRHEHAVDVEAGHAGRPELVEQEAADHRADDAEHDVEQQALALAVDNLAGDEAGDQPEHDPADDRHAVSFLPGLSGEVARGARAQVRLEQIVCRANRLAALGRAIPPQQATQPFSMGQAPTACLRLLGFPCASQSASKTSGARTLPHFWPRTLCLTKQKAVAQVLWCRSCCWGASDWSSSAGTYTRSWPSPASSRIGGTAGQPRSWASAGNPRPP